MNYQLELQQLVDYPRCRVYRDFIRILMADRSIRTGGCSGLFYFTVLCSYANFRTSYRRLDGISYTVYPGEWVCRLSELTQWFRVRFHHSALAILDGLQEKNLICYTRLGRKRQLVRFSIRGWHRHNTVLDYNCPCQKETGFFFLPVSIAADLIRSGRASEMDVVLDLWISAIYKDNRVLGSQLGPVVYLRNGTGNPLLNYTELSQRWGLSRSTVGRLLKKLSDLDYLSLMSFPGRSGSVIYLRSYLSTMFQISDTMVDKDEVALSLHLNADIPDSDTAAQDPDVAPEISVSSEPASVSKPHMILLARKVLQILGAQGLPCFHCSRIRYRLYPLSDDCKGTLKETRPVKLCLEAVCGSRRTLYRFALTLCPTETEEGGLPHGKNPCI